MNTKQLPLVSFEQAKKLKDLGFDWDVNRFYPHDNMLKLTKGPSCNYNRKDNWLSVPTVALALKWMCDEKRALISIIQTPNVTVAHGKYAGKVFHITLKSTDHAESAILNELLYFVAKAQEANG